MDNLEYPVIITYANIGYIRFADNLIKNLEHKVKYHKVHFFCLDKHIYSYLSSKQLPDNIIIELLDCNVSTLLENYNSSNYINLTHQKVKILKYALNKYNYIHFIDCDVVCINEPTLEFYKKYYKYDVVFQYDCGPPNPIYHPWTCTGNTTIRNTEGGQNFLNIIELYQQNYKHKNDQECLLEYFKFNNIDDIRNTTDFSCEVYPIEKYTNGFLLKHDVVSLNETNFFHANHVTGDIAKIELLKKARHWYLDN